MSIDFPEWVHVSKCDTVSKTRITHDDRHGAVKRVYAVKVVGIPTESEKKPYTLTVANEKDARDLVTRLRNRLFSAGWRGNVVSSSDCWTMEWHYANMLAAPSRSMAISTQAYDKLTPMK